MWKTFKLPTGSETWLKSCSEIRRKKRKKIPPSPPPLESPHTNQFRQFITGKRSPFAVARVCNFRQGIHLGSKWCGLLFQGLRTPGTWTGRWFHCHLSTLAHAESSMEHVLPRALHEDKCRRVFSSSTAIVQTCWCKSCCLHQLHYWQSSLCSKIVPLKEVWVINVST